MSNELPVLTTALQEHRSMEKLEQIVKDLLAQGHSKESILVEFESFRKKTTDEDYEDVVLDVMDFLTGWCSPHKRLETTSHTTTLTDENELIYFITYQLEVIEKAIEQFHQYLAEKHFDFQKAEQLLEKKIVGKLNHLILFLGE